MTNRFAVRLAATLAAIAAVGCASGPTYDDLATSLPAIAPGSGRLFVFLTGASEVPSFHPQLVLDGEPLGQIRPDTYLYADRPAGPHVLGVHVAKADASFGTQGATEPLQVALPAGGPAHVRAEVHLVAGMVEVNLVPVGADVAASEMGRLHPLAETEP